MLRKTSGLSGIASQAVIIGVVLVAVNNSPWFSWRENYLSDFGYRGTMTGLYNGGVVLTGLLSALFVYGLRKNLPLNRTGMRGMTSLFTGSLAFSVSGILTKATDLPHDIASSGSLILVVLGLLLTGAALIASPRVKLGLFSIGAGTLTMLVWLIPWGWPGEAIPQVLYFAAWSAWVFVFSAALLRMPETASEQESSLALSYTQ